MSQVSRATAKTYFNTGDTPTEAQFANLIDSATWYDEGVLVKNIQLSDAQIKGLLSVEGVKAQGTMTVSGQPTAGQTFNLGSIYQFVANGDPIFAGFIEIGANVAATRVNIVAAVNGTDGTNSASPYVSLDNFSGSTAIATAAEYGTDPITSTSAATNISFDAATLGTTRAGVAAVKSYIEVLPAPGVGFCYGFHRVWNVLDTTNGAYTFPAGVTYSNIKFFFGTHEVDAVDGDGDLSFDSEVVSTSFDDSTILGDSTFDFSGEGNVALNISSTASLNITGGGTGNTWSIRVFYSKLPSVPFS
jgi:hypothetical protein